MSTTTPCGHLCYCRKPEMAEQIKELKAEIEWLKAELHRTYSEVSSVVGGRLDRLNG